MRSKCVSYEEIEMKLYISTHGIIHLVKAGRICNHAIGKVKSNLEGSKDKITCKHCKIGVQK